MMTLEIRMLPLLPNYSIHILVPIPGTLQLPAIWALVSMAFFWSPWASIHVCLYKYTNTYELKKHWKPLFIFPSPSLPPTRLHLPHFLQPTTARLFRLSLKDLLISPKFHFWTLFALGPNPLMYFSSKHNRQQNKEQMLYKRKYGAGHGGCVPET